MELSKMSQFQQNMYRNSRQDDITGVLDLTSKVKKKSNVTIRGITPQEKGRNKVVFKDQKNDGDTFDNMEERQLLRLKTRLRLTNRHPSTKNLPWPSDEELLVWLRLNNYNIIGTASQLVRTWLFRKQRGLDNFLCDYTPPESLCAEFPGGVCGHDKDGSPVSYEMIGRLDIPKLMTSFTKQELITFKLWQFEVIKEHLKKISSDGNKYVGDILLVMDLRGTYLHNFATTALSFWGDILEIVQTHYPYFIKEILMIKPNGLYPDLYQALRHHMGHSVHDKITVLGHNYTRHLLMRIEKQQLPAIFGGYRCDANGDTMCRSDINWLNMSASNPMSGSPSASRRPTSHQPRCESNQGLGPQGAVSDALTHTRFSTQRFTSEVHNILVLGGCRHVIKHHVTLAGSKLTWNVDEMNHDFNMAIYRDKEDEGRPLGDGPRSLVLQHKLCLASRRRHGSTECPRPAIYIMVLDNSRHMAQPLRLRMRTSVEVPSSLVSKLVKSTPIGDFVNFSTMVSPREREITREY